MRGPNPGPYAEVGATIVVGPAGRYSLLATTSGGCEVTTWSATGPMVHVGVFARAAAKVAAELLAGVGASGAAGRGGYPAGGRLDRPHHPDGWDGSR